jgi:hypothetical protein
MTHLRPSLVAPDRAAPGCVNSTHIEGNFREVHVQMMDRSIQARVDELESRAAISALVAGYWEGVDRKNSERFEGLWHTMRRI